MSGPNDLVLIYFNEKPSLFARIEAIAPDVKKGWFRVNLLLLSLPMQTATWILRDEYIRGEPFTMGGKPVRMEPVKPVIPNKNLDPGLPAPGTKEKAEPGNVIPFKKPK